MKMNKKILIGCAIVSLSLLTGAILSGCLEKRNSSDESKILLRVTVINEEPPSNASYVKKGGEPKEVYIYKELPNPKPAYNIGFTKIETINLRKVDDLHYVGEKYINRSDVTLCVGYATTNFIDGASCVMINQSLNEVQLEVYYWNCTVVMI